MVVAVRVTVVIGVGVDAGVLDDDSRDGRANNQSTRNKHNDTYDRNRNNVVPQLVCAGASGCLLWASSMGG